MKQQKFKVMNLKTGNVFDITQTAMNSLKKYNLFHNYMLINEKPIEASVSIQQQEVKQQEVKQEQNDFAFTNYVETKESTTIELDNEKPKRKYNKKIK